MMLQLRTGSPIQVERQDYALPSEAPAFPGGHVVPPAVLCVGVARDDDLALSRILSGVPYQMVTADTCHGALDCLRQGCVSIVVCESKLPDGTWRDLLSFSRTWPEPPPLIVTSEHADRNFWAEVLNVGGFDVIARPFNAPEVLHVLETASLAHGTLTLERALLSGRSPRQ
jgi:DNA-binding NtrC family response regulator